MKGEAIEKTERACLVIADISGYTRYLQGVELDHAQDVLADLLSAVVIPMRPVFRLSELEGDAAFLYSPVEEIDGSMLLDLVEACYFNFRRRLLSIGQASTCECNACTLIPDLDLKLIAHYGTIVHQRMLDRDQLVGTDVIFVHRLLKNTVVTDLGVSAYALFTDACMNAMGLDAEALGMARTVQTYEDVGEVGAWVYDLAKAWRMEHERRRVYVSPEDAVWSASAVIPGASPAMVWDWLTNPRQRIHWEIGFDEIFERNLQGRRGLGTETHCVHGEGEITQEVVDWRPPRYVTNAAKLPEGVAFLSTDEVQATDGGVVVSRSLKARSFEERDRLETVLQGYLPVIEQWMHRLSNLVVAEIEKAETAGEPELPPFDEDRRLATAIHA